MCTGLRAFGKTAILAVLVLAIGACGPDAHQSLQSSQVPAGDRTGVTSVSTLAAYRVGDRRFILVSFDDQSGAPCIAVDQPGIPGIAACGISLNASHQVNAAIQNMGGGITAIYGRAGNSVRQIQALIPNGRVVNVAIYPDHRGGRRYFAVLDGTHSLIRLIAITPSGMQPLNDLDAKLAAFLD